MHAHIQRYLDAAALDPSDIPTPSFVDLVRSRSLSRPHLLGLAPIEFRDDVTRSGWLAAAQLCAAMFGIGALLALVLAFNASSWNWLFIALQMALTLAYALAATLAIQLGVSSDVRERELTDASPALRLRREICKSQGSVTLGQHSSLVKFDRNAASRTANQSARYECRNHW